MTQDTNLVFMDLAKAKFIVDAHVCAGEIFHTGGDSCECGEAHELHVPALIINLYEPIPIEDQEGYEPLQLVIPVDSRLGQALLDGGLTQAARESLAENS